MADVITRLKLETTQYDSKLRDASKDLSEFAREASKAGSDFQKLAQGNMEAARSFGNIATSATNSKDKLKELVSAYNDVAKAYNGLTQEQQKSDFGKALAESLDKLKVRIADTKQELQNFGGGIKATKSDGDSLGGMLDGLAGKFGVNITQAGALGAALGVTAAATKVAKDAFFSNEEQLDEWGRTVEASESVYRGFLNAINNGDISGFLSKISSIVKAARDAYDAIDDLATYNAFNQINVERTRHELSESINDFREGSGSKDKVKAAGDAVIKELRTRQKKEQNAYVKAVGKLAAERGVSQKDLFDAMSGSYGDYDDLKNTKPTGKRTVFYGGGMFGGGGSYQVATPQNRREQLGQALRRINDDELRSLQALGAQAQRTSHEIDGVVRQVIRVGNSRTGGGGGGGRVVGGGGVGGHTGGTPTYVPVAGSIDAQAALVANLQKQWRAAADDDSREKLKSQIDEATKALDQMQGKTEAPIGSLKYYQDELADLQKKQQLVTNNNDWLYYAGQIDVVNEKIKDLKGEIEPLATGLSGATANNIGEWISAQKKSLENMDMGSSEASQTYANIIDAKTLENVLNYALADDISISPDTVEDLWEQVIGGDNIPDSVWEDLQETINDSISELGTDPIEINVKTGDITQVAKKTKESWKDAAQAVQAVGAALQQIENPAAKVAGIVGEAIANIALGFAQATAKDSKLGVFGWIAAIAGGLGTMISTISAIKSATAGSYAEGGIIPGHDYNDGLIANVSSGELILNRAQQNNLAGQLTNGGIGELHLSTIVSAEDIRFVLDNNGRRTGRGEYVTSKG